MGSTYPWLLFGGICRGWWVRQTGNFIFSGIGYLDAVRRGCQVRAVPVEFDAAAKFRYLRSFPVPEWKLTCHTSNAFFLSREIALEIGLTFGNDAPTMR